MKKLSVCFVLCSVLWSATCSAAKADTTEVESSISAVNVFFQGARITRDAKLSLNSGRHVLSLKGLPLDLDPDLIKIKTPSGLKLLALSRTAGASSGKSVADDIRILDKERDELEDRIDWLRAKKEVFAAEETVLMDNTELKRAGGKTYTQSISEAADFYRERLTELAQMRFDNTLEIRKAQERIRKINTEANHLKAGSQIPKTELLIFVEAVSVVSGKLSVEYFTHSAGWEPLYNLRFEAVNSPLELVYNASVYQSTGEDWEEVNLSLTEGLPKQKAAMPEFDRWYITQRPSSVPAARQEAHGGSGTLKGTLTDSQTGEPLPFVNIFLQTGDKQVAGTSTDLDGSYTIKPIADGNYSVQVSYVGYHAKRVEGVRINDGKITFLDIELEYGVILEEFEVVEYSTPLIDKDGGSSGGSVSLHGRSSNSYSSITSLRGGRNNQTNYYVDGVKTRGSLNTAKLFLDDSPSISSPRITYSINFPYSVPSSGEDRLLTITTEKIPVDFLYRSMPKVDTDVYLMARISDWGNLKLLSGNATIYYQGAYSGESNLNAKSVKDTLEIALGRDENILLERRLNKELSSEQTFGNKVRKEMHWEIQVRNNKSHPIVLELIDQLPLSDNHNVAVEALTIGEAKREKDSGKLTWELRLEPNSSKKIAFGYELKYPESAVVNQ